MGPISASESKGGIALSQGRAAPVLNSLGTQNVEDYEELSASQIDILFQEIVGRDATIDEE